MGKFKQYILNEDIGLGELGARIDNLFHSHEFGNQIQGAYVSTSGAIEGSQSGYSGSMRMPSTDLTIPSAERQGRITVLELKRNPIYVRLSDGTEAHFTYDEYKRINGKPELGKVMKISFQRHPDDQMRQYSKIENAIVL